MASDINLNRFCNGFCNEIDAFKNQGSRKITKRKTRSSIHPLKLIRREACEGTRQKHCKAGTQDQDDQDPTKQMAYVQCTPGQGFHVCCSCFVLSRYLHGSDTHTGSTVAFVAFPDSVPPICLPYLLHSRVQNNFCNFSIFSRRRLFASFTCM